MADFLTRLASRTLGLAPVAEPVIAPIFAPDPSLPAMTGLDEEFDALQRTPEPMLTPSVLLPASSPESVVRPIAPRPRPAPVEVRLTQPSVGEPAARAATAVLDAALIGDIPRQRPPERAIAAGSAADEDEFLLPSADALRPPSLVGTSQPAGTPLSAQAAAPDRSRTPSMWSQAPAAASGRPAAGQDPSVPPQDVEADDLLLPLSPVESLAAKPDSHAAAVVAPTDESERPRRAERGQAAASAAPPLPPTIEITIGRVEVRATMGPPAPVARPQPVAQAAPRLSLEEYLRNQNGGRR